jgi:hypothetical protein
MDGFGWMDWMNEYSFSMVGFMFYFVICGSVFPGDRGMTFSSCIEY